MNCQPEALIKDFKLFANDKRRLSKGCQGELVEPGSMEETRLRQAQADTLIV